MFLTIASSYSGTSDHQLQNKYCGGRFTDEDTTAYNHGSIIGIVKTICYTR